VRVKLPVVAAVAFVLVAGCSGPPVEPLLLEGNQLTVVNNSGRDWTDLEVWVNQQFRVTAPRLLNGQSYRAPLDHFVTGYGRRFDFSRMPINDVRLNAKASDGVPFEITKRFTGNALADALKGMGGKR
jgi:hypothetical protein